MVRIVSAPRLSPKQLISYNEYLEDSSCTVQIFKKKEQLKGIWIAFSGPIAHLPSANRREISYINKKGGGKRPILRKSDVTTARLSVMTALFGEALIDMGIGVPTFTQSKINVVCLHAEKAGRWDLDNREKLLGDWLTDVGIITDDSNIQIHSIKKSDYVLDFPILGTTELIIQPLDQIYGLSRTYIEQIKRASTGYEYIG